MKDKTQYWIDLSDYDLETATAMLSTKRFLYVAFMCHQSIEKMLKAYITEKINDEVPYSHSLDYLSKKAGLKEVMDSGQENLIFTLEPMNIEARYPTHKERLLKGLDYNYCEKLINDTGILQVWIRQQLLKN